MKKNKIPNDIVKDWSDIEIFTRKGAKISTPYITISTVKSIVLNCGFLHYAKKQIADSTHVILLYSRSKNVISFNFTRNSQKKGAIKMTIKSNAHISARSFFNYYSINISESKRYEAKLEDIPNMGKLWCIYL